MVVQIRKNNMREQERKFCIRSDMQYARSWLMNLAVEWVKLVQGQVRVS